jgi:hypothetical protein
MKARIPPGTRAERVDFARDERIRQQQLALPILRMSRVHRRVAVVVLYLLLVATAIVLRVGPGTWTTGWSDLMTLAAKGFAAVALLVVVLATLVGAQVVVFVVISYSIHRWTTGIETLDERERTERDRATVVAYKLLSVAVVVLTFYAIAAAGHNGLPVPTTGWQLLMFLLPLYSAVITLPTAMLAWRLPDPEPDLEA